MPGLDLTTVHASTLDIKRKLAGNDTKTLRLVRIVPGKAVDGGGYKVLKTITAGWNFRRVTRKGDQVFEVKIADLDGTLATLMDAAETPTHVQVDTTVYEKTAVDDPVKASRLWVIKCNPTGEKVTI